MRILFLFTHNWDHEIAKYRDGIVPSHRLWGFADVEKLGHQPAICPKPRWFSNRLTRPGLWWWCQAIHAARRQRETDCIVAVHEVCAIPALVLKRCGLLRTPLVILNMALLHPANCKGFKKTLWRWLLPAADAVISLASAHCGWISEEFNVPRKRQFFARMLVDSDFFKAEADVERDDFWLAAGTNDAKDYITLLKALPPGQRLIVVTDAYNASLIEKNRDPLARIEVRQEVPIAELRSLYQRARLIIIPLADTRFGSGHTVLLENMALGRAVIVSATASMRDYAIHELNALTVRPHDVDDLRQKIELALSDHKLCEGIGCRAAEWARANCDSLNFGHRLLEIIEHVTSEEDRAIDISARRDCHEDPLPVRS
jgi:glycosyltransferase involved in cell wall biosynthesis